MRPSEQQVSTDLTPADLAEGERLLCEYQAQAAIDKRTNRIDAAYARRRDLYIGWLQTHGARLIPAARRGLSAPVSAEQVLTELWIEILCEERYCAQMGVKDDRFFNEAKGWRRAVERIEQLAAKHGIKLEKTNGK